MNTLPRNNLLTEKPSTTTDFNVSIRLYWLLLLSQVANLSLLATQLSLWMLALIGLSLVWRVTLLHGQLQSPSRWLLSTFAITGCIILAISAKQLGLLLSMVHLLCFAYGLKQLELNKRHDFYQLFLIGLFVLASAMIFNQALYFSIIMVLVLLLNISVLFTFFTPILPYLSVVKATTKLFIQSTPLAIILFVVFPRVAPFWQVPLANSAKTGLSDRVAPGDIANLIQSGDLAFRVNFSDKKPLFNQLYWRALVLDNYDGNSWIKSQQSNLETRAIIAGKWQFQPQLSVIANQPKTSVSYQIIVQPSYQHWLFSLAIPRTAKISASNNVMLLPDFTLINKTPITQAMSYQVTSLLQTPLNVDLSIQSRTRNLAIPLDANPRLVNEASRLRQLFSNDEQLIKNVLQSIRQKNYRYTLKPPLLRNNSLDQFYFETQAGFCVHYASSFTYLMRAAGIPARLVTGYMGGEYNRNGDYYSIYQYDAHAWSEVWLKGKGWVRVDPTAAVSPDRVEKGFSQSLFAQQSTLSGNIFSLQNYRNIAWINYFRQQINALDYQWTRWVIGYTPERQFKLLSHWFGHYKAWQIALLAVVAFTLIILWLWLTNRSKTKALPISPWFKIYRQALLLLQSKNIIKTNQQSVSQFSTEVTKRIPQVGKSFLLLSENFEQLNYCPLMPDEQQKRLEQMQRQFSLFSKGIKHYKRRFKFSK